MMCKGTSWVGEMRNCSDGETYCANNFQEDCFYVSVYQNNLQLLLLPDKPPWGIEEFSGGIGLPSVGMSFFYFFINIC